MPTFNNRVNPRLGKRERLAVSSSPVGITASVYVIAGSSDGKLNDRRGESALLQVFTDAIYYTIDGSTPSSTVGFKANVGDTIVLNSYQQIAGFKAVRVTSDCSIEVLPLFPA